MQSKIFLQAILDTLKTPVRPPASARFVIRPGADGVDKVTCVRLLAAVIGIFVRPLTVCLSRDLAPRFSSMPMSHHFQLPRRERGRGGPVSFESVFVLGVIGGATDGNAGEGAAIRAGMMRRG